MYTCVYNTCRMYHSVCTIIGARYDRDSNTCVYHTCHMYRAAVLTADAIKITLDRIACNQLVTMRKTLSKIQQVFPHCISFYHLTAPLSNQPNIPKGSLGAWLLYVLRLRLCRPTPHCTPVALSVGPLLVEEQLMFNSCYFNYNWSTTMDWERFPLVPLYWFL